MISLQTLRSEKARPFRFILTGGTGAAVQLGCLRSLTFLGWSPFLGDVVAFLVAAQINFLLSYLFTWGDRRRESGIGLARCWSTFHVSIAGTFVLNMVVFTASSRILPTMLAAALGILVASIGNFFLGDRLVFGSQSSVEAVADEPVMESLAKLAPHRGVADYVGGPRSVSAVSPLGPSSGGED